jgi:hypothetical protein
VPWSASAAYPNLADVPSALCVNLYDEHGSAGKSSGNANDFSATGDADNSIQTNDYNPATGGNCSHVVPHLRRQQQSGL